MAEGTGEPYGINRQVVEGAARAGAARGTNVQLSDARQLDSIPVPALNQVAAASDSDLPHHQQEAGEVVDGQPGEEITTVTSLGEGQENPLSSSSGGVKGGGEGLPGRGVDLEVQVKVEGK